MEELRSISGAYFDGLRSTAKEGLLVLFDDAYGSMDRDEDGLVSFPALSDYMTRIGRPDLANEAFFSELDSDGDGKLDWDNVRTLAYVILSGRPMCSSCGYFIRSTYFTCVTCFRDNQHPYVLCFDCHQNIRDYVDHEHEDFTDNFLLFELLRMENSTRATSNPASVPRSQASSSEVVDEVMPTQNSSSTTVVTTRPARTQPAHARPQPFHWRDVLNIAGLGVSATSLLSQCCVM